MKATKAMMLMMFFITLNFVGVASATSTKIVDRVEYSTTLNSVAAVIMNWYGSLISANKNAEFSSYFYTKEIDKKWGDYRAQYPKGIVQIIITSTKLSKQNDTGHYQFQVKSKITYKEKSENLTQSLNETFVFSKSLLIRETGTSIQSVSREKPINIKTLELSGFNRAHYKVREFTYAWLAYMDGIHTLEKTMNAKAWLNKASYTLKMGGEKLISSVHSVLEKKKSFLTTGGHLLRSLDIKYLSRNKGKDDSNIVVNTFVINLILEWKGTNKSGKPVVARIHQEITVRINDDQIWEVISINEKHLLPIIGAWMGLVC